MGTKAYLDVLGNVNTSEKDDEVVKKVPAGRAARKKVPIDKVRPNPFNTFNMSRDEQYEDLVHGMKKGREASDDILCQPEDENGIYYIISGERRWNASKEAGKEEVYIKILSTRIKGSMEVAEIVNQNGGRRKNYPYDIPLALKLMYKEFVKEGITDPDEQYKRARELITLAKDRTFANYHKLSQLPEDILKIGQEEHLNRDEGLFLADSMLNEAMKRFTEKAFETLREIAASEMDDEHKTAACKKVIKALHESVERKEKRDRKTMPTAFSFVKKINTFAVNGGTYKLPTKKSQRENLQQMIDQNIEFLEEMKAKLLNGDTE